MLASSVYARGRERAERDSFDVNYSLTDPESAVVKSLILESGRVWPVRTTGGCARCSIWMGSEEKSRSLLVTERRTQCDGENGIARQSGMKSGKGL